jgi:signal peptidase I
VTRCGGGDGIFTPGQPPKAKDAFIKRVIGLPGEKVEIKDGKVLVNGQPLSENYTIEIPPSLDTKHMEDGKLDGQPLENYPIKVPQANYPEKLVPQDSYLVFGDNRNQSCDGRFWGVVPRQNMIGKAVVRFWPLNHLGGISPKPPYQN